MDSGNRTISEPEEIVTYLRHWGQDRNFIFDHPHMSVRLLDAALEIEKLRAENEGLEADNTRLREWFAEAGL